MTPKQGLPVLVGMDGSEQSSVAALWASEEADLRDAPLRLVAVAQEGADEEAWEFLSDAADRCRSERPRAEIFEEIRHGRPIEELIWASGDAQLLVIGSRGRGRVAEAVLGSVSTAVAMHARCPVVVVRDARNTFTTGPVVVGVDGSEPSRVALRFAFETASTRRSGLVAVRVWRPINAEYSWAESPPGVSLFSLDDAQRELADELGEWREKYPNVEVRGDVRFGHPVEELTSAALHSQLLVVGHRGLGGFQRLLLGSVASGVLHHVNSPVAIVRSFGIA
ncbi:universal stress protein [Saccharopolyspora sp. NPDC002376]